MPRQGDGELVVQDVVLRFEVGGLQREDVGEGGGRCAAGEGGEEGVRAEELGQARGGEGVLGRDVECGAGEPVGRGELRGEEEGEEELGLAGAAWEGVVSRWLSGGWRASGTSRL